MSEVFGIPMSTIMVVLLGLLSVCLLSVAWVAWRRPVIFKLGVRNIPRRKAQTILIVVGLMLSTLIMSAALGTGDTVDYSMTSDVYDTYGQVDEQVIASQEPEASSSAGHEKIDASALTLVEQTLAGNADVEAVMPELREVVPALNDAAQISEPNVALVGLDPARLDGFGGLKGTDGASIDLAAIPAGSVVLSETAADDLKAKTGDAITIFYDNQPIALTVAAVAEDSYLSGAGRDFVSGLESIGMVMPLDRLQELTGQPETLTSVLISNTGGVRDGIDRSDAVVDALSGSLAGQGLGVAPVKQDLVDLGESFGQVFTGLFLVLGLFSVAAGILLIVLIFTMLAAERRSEMGMARAVGAHRRQLIQQFVSEGSGYALVAGLVGAGLGVLAAYGIGYGMEAIFGDYVPITPHVTVRSLIVAYALGVVITFLAVVGSSWKISRLNVVAAIRDIPDVATSQRRKRTLVWAGLLLLAGGLLTMSGVSGGSAFPFYAGMSLLPFGVALILRFFGFPSRPIFSAIGLYLIVFWLLPEKQFERIFGEYDGDIEMFFLSGIFMVIGATILIVQNTDVLLKGVTALGGVFRSKLPAIRTAVAYPGAARGRTGLTIAMFSLIIFSLVMIATMNKNYTELFLGDEANAGWQVRADATSANPIGDFQGTLAAEGVDTSGFEGVGVQTSPGGGTQYARLPGTTEWKTTSVYGEDDGFFTNAELTFGQRAAGYESDADIVEALRTQPNVAIVDSSMVTSDDFGTDDEAFMLDGLSSSDKVFQPITVELADPAGGEPHAVTIIGVLDSKISVMWGLFTNEQTLAEVYPDAQPMQSYFVKLADADASDAVADSIEAALLQNGVQATSIQDELEEGQRQSTGFIYIIQGFMGLGLVVGIAAIGVIAFRSVVERRQQIGVLRAIGYQRSMVSLSFMIETAFVVGIGSLAGTGLGLMLARNLFTSDAQADNAAFLIPWALIVVILAVTVVTALLMTWIPSRQASRIAPAEALRFE